MVDTARARRLAKRIVAIVATELEHEVKDPRLAMVTITAATVTPDLREATVFYTVFGDDEERQASAQALTSATGVLRSAVGRHTGIKFTPILAFKPDAVPESSRHIEDLLAKVAAADADLARQAAGASFAGDADPYRSAADNEDDDYADEHADAQTDDQTDERSGEQHDQPAGGSDRGRPAEPAGALAADRAIGELGDQAEGTR